MDNEKTGRSVAKLFWGRTAELSVYARAAMLIFALVAIASMSFCQLGFWPMGEIGDSPISLILLLIPTIMGAIAFGPLMGALLGLFGGIAASIHGMYLPLDYLEAYYFGVPLNTILLFTFVACIAGVLFDLVLKNDPQGGKRAAYIIVVSFFVSFLASMLLLVSMVMLIGGFELFSLAEAYLGMSFASSAVQALVDSVLIAAMCLLVDYIVRRVEKRGSDRGIFSVFRNSLMLVSAIVFMLTSAVIFTTATIQELSDAKVSIDAELAFMQDQIDLQPDIDVQLLLGEYDKDIDGVVFTTNNRGVILASNDDEKFKVGSSFLADIGQGAYLGDENSIGAVLEYYSSGREPVITIQDTDDDLSLNSNLAFMGIRKCKDGYVVLHRTSAMVFSHRLGTMVSTTVLALVLVAAIAFLASMLVRRLIVRRIDETNQSLAKITLGQLDERIPPQSTREFTSLANGINSTVKALSDMIDEVARRNEQDLATAKTIQESSLPTDFPAFPNIDSFDIYASMKTAREVGGDFYDFFDIEGTKKIGFVMADVSGKGIPAALFMMAARSELRNFLEAGMSVDEAVDAANHQLCIGNDAGMFVTCWVAVLDYETGELSYVNAGHNPPMFMHDGTWSWLTEVSGMPLGLFDGIPYDLHTLQMVPHDMLYTYTDGVTEAMNTSDELFGEDRLETVLNKNRDMNPRSVGVAVRRALTDYTHDAEQSDDITMLILKYGVPPKVEAVMVLPAEEAQLIHVRNFINAELDRRKAPKQVYSEIDTLAEELFMSVCRYAYPDATPENPGEVRVGFEFQPNPSVLKITIADDGVAHDPLAEISIPAEDGTSESSSDDQSAAEGMQILDDVSYERVDGSNIISFSKSW